MAEELKTLHAGKHGELHREFQAALNRRLRARGLDSFLVKEDGVTGDKTLVAARKAAWALGALSSTYEKITKDREISVGVQRLVRNPGKRTDRQLSIAKKRLAQMEADRKKRAKEASSVKGARKRIVDLAQQAAANYRKNPGAYHYLAGGVANTVFLKPTPRNWRSDCSQFVASVYKAAGVDSPAEPLEHQWASTYSIESSPHTRVTTNPRPGDLGMYGPHGATHHVELYCAEPGQEFIGHGSPPIDSLTPGRPDFYLTCDFLN